MGIINKFGTTLNKQENDKLWRMLEEKMQENALLKEQIANVQGNFELLLKHGFEEWAHKAIHRHSLSTNLDKW